MNLGGIYMNEDLKIIQFNRFQKIYYRVTWLMVTLSLSFFALGYFAAQAVRAVPTIIVEASGFFLYYHAVHFIAGFILVIYFGVKIRPIDKGIKIGKSILSIFITPLSACIAYFAFIILVFTGCAAN